MAGSRSARLGALTINCSFGFCMPAHQNGGSICCTVAGAAKAAGSRAIPRRAAAKAVFIILLRVGMSYGPDNTLKLTVVLLHLLPLKFVAEIQRAILASQRELVSKRRNTWL